MGDPTITRNDDGTLTVGWPDPPRRTYEVAHEALQFLVDDYNEVVCEVARLTAQGLDDAAILWRKVRAAEADRDRLADGIRGHHHDIWHGDAATQEAADERLHALLDVAGDDPPVPYRALEGSEGGEDG